MKTSELLKSLGWRESGFFANRMFYSFGSYSLCIHLHDDSCYLASKKGINYHNKLSENQIRDFTGLIKRMENIKSNLKFYSAYDYVNAQRNLSAFIFRISK